VSGPLAVGVDVGGTHLRAGLVDADGLVGPIVRRESEVDDLDLLIASIVDVLEELGAGPGRTIPVGIGMAGLVERDGRFSYGPNVGIGAVPLGSLLIDALGDEDRIVRVVNDASAAVVGEHRAGAARGHRDVVMFTLGTGVGGGAVVDGRLLEGAHGFAAEFGHLVIVEGGRDAPSGIRGTVEAYTSGTAIGREAADAFAAGITGAPVSGSREVVAAAAAAEPWALSVLEDVGSHLGVAIASVVSVLDPSVVVIGGGAGDAACEFLLPAARRSLAAHLIGAEHREVPPVVPAQLGDDAGVIGAALIAADAAAAAHDGGQKGAAR
jgi:glucokinase